MNDERSMSASLDKDEEAALWQALAEGSEDARERLILAYRPMVFWLARKFRVPYSAYSDLIQEGMIGLIAAVDNFEPARNNKFSTYAYYKMYGSMINFLQRSEQKAPVPVDDEILDRPGVHESFDSVIDRMEWSLAIEDGLETLPEKERSVVRSLMIDGRRAADVANDHGVGVSHIYRIQRKAMERLKGWFALLDGAKDATLGA